jgi:predicted esterase
LCEKDQALPVEKQQAMIDKAREQGADVQVTRISAGHSPFLSKVDETVGWVRGVAGEKV